MKVLITATSLKPGGGSPALDRLRRFADEIAFNPFKRPLAPEELIPLLKGCEGYIAGLDYITGEVIGACGALRVISRYGAGVDRVDIAAAKSRGIAVCNTPGANAQAVADLAMGLVLSLARKIPALDSGMRQGRWERSTGVELYGKTMGILGLGAIGKAVAKRAQGFSMRVLAYDPYIDLRYAEENGITAASFLEAVTQSDAVSLHLPLTDKTRHILGKSEMEAMKPGAILINTARGGLIDEDAAYEMLSSGRLGGLGLDVYEKEPPEKSPLFGLENVVLTPHTASHTKEAAENMADMSVDNLINVLSGKPCPYIL